MPDINELFEQLPDYDVFSGKTTPAKPKRSERVQKNASAVVERDKSDYGDGFGVYVVKKQYIRNYLTVFFFPITLLWLEMFLRLAVGGDFGFNCLLYTFIFSMVISCVLTLLCTFGSRVFNLVLSNLFTLVLALWFAFQLLYRTTYGRFFSFSHNTGFDFGKLFSYAGEKAVFLALLCVPLLFSLIIGHKLFTFKRIRIPAKISLLLLAVLMQLSVSTMISLSKNNPYVNTSYNLYRLELKENEAADRFGLLTMQRLDAVDLIIGD